MFLNTLKAYGFMALSIFLASMLGLQTWRLHTAQLEVAAAVSTLADERAVASAALATQQGENRKTEAELNTSAAQTRKATNDQVHSLGPQRDGLLKRVRIAEANAATAALVSQATAAARSRCDCHCLHTNHDRRCRALD